MLKSRIEHEVERINVYQDCFLVANTAHTIMLGDMETCCLSEVSWETSGTEKYHFDNPQVWSHVDAQHSSPCIQVSSCCSMHADYICGCHPAAACMLTAGDCFCVHLV